MNPFFIALLVCEVIAAFALIALGKTIDWNGFTNFLGVIHTLFFVHDKAGHFIDAKYQTNQPSPPDASTKEPNQ